jgi:hypothetical protein
MGLYLGNSENLKIIFDNIVYVSHSILLSNKHTSVLGKAVLGIMKLGVN